MYLHLWKEQEQRWSQFSVQLMHALIDAQHEGTFMSDLLQWQHSCFLIFMKDDSSDGQVVGRKKQWQKIHIYYILLCVCVYIYIIYLFFLRCFTLDPMDTTYYNIWLKLDVFYIIILYIWEVVRLMCVCIQICKYICVCVCLPLQLKIIGMNVYISYPAAVKFYIIIGL